MKAIFKDMSAHLMHRPMKDEELDTLRRHAKWVKQTPSIALELKQREPAIVYATVKQLYAKYPEYLERYQNCELKTARDMRSVLGYCLYAVVLDDPDYAKDRMLYWFRTILNAFEFGNAFIEDAYRMLQAEVAAQMSEDTSPPMMAMLEEAITVFTSPELN
ncbi:hypothetical protein [Candidatus Entotheonella palauensis]|uniref:hypothetical protein n=1 Tax=Candidatus Entotheonella palauensis TaxID=93172 RepID=UPI000B7D4CDC|nr:hypothetical protein [Candidatus Entotheonella palauensis]